MATQTDSSPQPKKSRANSQSRHAQSPQLDIASSASIKVPRQDAESLTHEQRRELIAVTAYYMAESRNFEPGHEDEDWLAAELKVGSLGARVS